MQWMFNHTIETEPFSIFQLHDAWAVPPLPMFACSLMAAGVAVARNVVCRRLWFMITVALVTGAVAAEKRTITEKDLFDFVWIGDPQVSPDGNRVAFVRVTVNEKREGYNTSIWSVPVAGGEKPHQLTRGDHDSTPRWSPDGKSLLFLRASEKDGKPEPAQLSILPM